MRPFVPLVLSLLPAFGVAQTQPNPPALVTVQVNDPTLAVLLREAMDHNPELAKGKALVEAEQARIPQARALPDPSLTLGLQNDGFKKLQIGMMESSYYQVMLTQPLLWPGKRNLRGEIAKLGVEIAQTELKRGGTTLVANVKRAYFGLLLVRGQKDLLNQQSIFWQKAGEITKVRYEVGQGSQADLLRSQLEQIRLRQTRLTLDSEEKGFLAALNRLRGQALDTPIPTTARLETSPFQVVPAQVWLDRAEMECCEIQDARLALKQTERSLDLAKRDRYPDFAVTAGLMPRGSFEPMWQVGISISLPLWSGQKQKQAVSEQNWRRRANESELQNVRSLLMQRIHERNAQMEAALETINLYRSGLLVQSEASFQANLAQYEGGRGSFLAVLEALNGWIADQGGYLQALAQAQAVQIAQEEFNLTGTPPISAQGLTSGAMGMGGSLSGTSIPSSSAKPGAALSTSGPAMKSM